MTQHRDHLRDQLNQVKETGRPMFVANKSGETEPEARRLMMAVVWPRLNDDEQALAWSAWRRRHQTIARRCYYHARTPDNDARL